MEKNKVTVFEFEHQNVECVLLNNEPLFNPCDVAKCLDLKESSVDQYIYRMDDAERFDSHKMDTQTLKNLKFFEDAPRFWVKEPGLYQLIFKSRKPEAQRFVKWVTHEVLPKIRETGSYELEEQNILTRQLLDNMTRNLQQLTGVLPAEVAITQNESWNKRLSNLMIDCSTRGMGSVKELYEELFHVFAGETGIYVPELAELKGFKRMEYLRRNKELCKMVYEFAHRHFSSNSRQIILVPLDMKQKTLVDFGGY